LSRRLRTHKRKEEERQRGGWANKEACMRVYIANGREVDIWAAEQQVEKSVVKE
jgi:hypothetical protein